MDDEPASTSGRNGLVHPELSNTELVERLRADRCTGLLWVLAAARLAAIGTGTLHRHLLDGSVNAKLTALRRPVHLSGDELERLRDRTDERDDMVADAVARGLVLLRDRAILAGEWHPDKGADLMTYFVNACFLALPNQIRAWRSGAPPVPILVRDPADVPDIADPHSDPHTQAFPYEDLDAIVEQLPPDIAAVARTYAREATSWAEAARRHGMSPRAVEGHLRRLRERRWNPEDPR